MAPKSKDPKNTLIIRESILKFSEKRLQFGPGPDGSETHELTVENLGNIDLIINDITIVRPPLTVSGFSITQFPPPIIRPGDRKPMRITFRPTAPIPPRDRAKIVAFSNSSVSPEVLLLA